MSITIQAPAQALATAITTFAITFNQKGNAAAIVGRANAALIVGQALASGNLATVAAAVQTAVNIQGLEPGYALALQSLGNLLITEMQALLAIQQATPLVSELTQAVESDVSAGMIAAANAEIAKWTPLIPPAAK